MNNLTPYQWLLLVGIISEQISNSFNDKRSDAFVGILFLYGIFKIWVRFYE